VNYSFIENAISNGQSVRVYDYPSMKEVTLEIMAKIFVRTREEHSVKNAFFVYSFIRNALFFFIKFFFAASIWLMRRSRAGLALFRFPLIWEHIFHTKKKKNKGGKDGSI